MYACACGTHCFSTDILVVDLIIGKVAHRPCTAAEMQAMVEMGIESAPKATPVPLAVSVVVPVLVLMFALRARPERPN